MKILNKSKLKELNKNKHCAVEIVKYDRIGNKEYLAYLSTFYQWERFKLVYGDCILWVESVNCSRDVATLIIIPKTQERRAREYGKKK